jgi:hypothetical protein
MTYINIDLRLNNLSSFTQSFQNLFRNFSLAKTIAASNSSRTEKSINDRVDFYAKATKRDISIISIDRQLKAQGNAW